MKSFFAPLVTFLLIPVALIGQDTTVDFRNDILPILEANCVRCHIGEEPEGGFLIDTKDEALTYIEPGDSESSDFYEYLITDDEDSLMPPRDEGGPLDDSDIRMIKTWINEGASWPDGVVLQDPEANAISEIVESGTDENKNAAAVTEGPDIYKAIGLLHPATIHLPIGLLMAAGLFAFLSLRGNFVMSDCAYYCLWLGALAGIVACLTGWWFTIDQYPNEVITEFEQLTERDNKLFWHRTSALVVSALALLLALFAASARNRDPDEGVGWKLCLIVLACGIGFVGHQGGKLTWKANHYDELFEAVDHYVPGLINSGQEEDAKENDPPNESDESSIESDAAGQTSD